MRVARVGNVLLIVPEGIEILMQLGAFVSFNELLIVPEGIEMIDKWQHLLRLPTFNRTRRN